MMHRLFAIGRHDGGHRFRHRGGHGSRHGFMGGRGGGDIPGGRKLSSAELQLVILALLAERPAHGYELIKTIEERSGGFYDPSPGMIYPALTYLEEIGYAVPEQEGSRRRYSITDTGRAHLTAHRAQADSILDTLSRIGGRMEQVREAFAGIDDLDAGASDELHRARHELRHALRRKRGCNPAEAHRITRILDRATAEILGQGDL
jgi:DNA-binding PadR family transcriptional regulator